MNEDQTPQEIVAEVQEMVKTVWTTGAAPLTETDVREHLAIEAVNGANHEFRTFQSSANFGKAGDADRIRKMKEELRLKMAARYGNRHDRRQAEAMGRKARTKAKHLAWKKALQKGTPVAATPLPSGAHQPGILNSAQWAVRQLARDINDWRVEEVQAPIPGVAWIDAGGSGTEIDS